MEIRLSHYGQPNPANVEFLAKWVFWKDGHKKSLVPIVGVGPAGCDQFCDISYVGLP